VLRRKKTERVWALCLLLLLGGLWAFVGRTERDYRTYENPELAAAGVVPYALVDGSAKLLLGKQTEEGRRAGFWQGFGGGRDPGETLFETALREFAEESRQSLTDVPSPYEAESYPMDGVFATEHKNCRYFQLMVPVAFDPDLSERFQKGAGETQFEREKSEFRWVDLQKVMAAVYRARILGLVEGVPPSELSVPVFVPEDEEMLLAHNFLETLIIQMLNSEDGIHSLLSGKERPKMSFSSDGAPDFFLGKGLSLNTGNLDKLKEFQKYFGEAGRALSMTTKDLREIVAEPEVVVMHKASQMPDHVIVEDTSLEVEGAEVGVNVKWLLDNLKNLVGRRATWTVFLGLKDHGRVYTFKGVVGGEIVEPRGKEGFGFDRVFLPDGAKKTLAEEKPERYNARAKAIRALLNGDIHGQGPEITEWSGPWQEEEGPTP